MTVAAMLATKGSEIITTTASATVADAAETLAAHKIGAVIVLGEGAHIAGIVSERDIVRVVAQRGAAALNESVADVMTRKVVTCGVTETVDEVMARMTRGRFRHLPVVEKDRLIGIVSIGDVVKARIEQVEREAEDMRAYIAAAV